MCQIQDLDKYLIFAWSGSGKKIINKNMLKNNIIKKLGLIPRGSSASHLAIWLVCGDSRAIAGTTPPTC